MGGILISARGVALVGANGSGKTTLGKHLAGLLQYKHLDAEDYSFKDSACSNPYKNPRPKEEVRALLLADMKKHGSFILSAVNCDFGDEINAMYGCVIYLKAPLETRLQRIRQRSLGKFGSRVLKGGDMYEQEEAFYAFVASRTMDKTDAWLQRIKRPIICADGTLPVEINAERIKARIAKYFTPHR